MFSAPSFVIATWLLSVGAAPLDPPFDACGPKTPGPDPPQDSCFSSPPTVKSAASFGVLGSSDEDHIHEYDWATCNPVLNLICNQMFAPNFTTNTWFFQTGPSKDASGRPSPPCQMGFWISNTVGAAGRPGTITNSNRTMNATNPQRQCKNIFQTMLNAAASQVPNSIGSSINLLQNPATAKGQFQLPGGSGTGKAVDPGYPSYVLAFNTTWTQSVDPDSQGQAPQAPCIEQGTTQTCTCGSSDTCVSSEAAYPQPQVPTCTDSQTGQPCSCGSSKTCQNGGANNRACVDTESRQYCKCGSSPACMSLQTVHPSAEVSTCTDAETGQSCPCGSSATCGDAAVSLSQDCSDSETGHGCVCGSTATCTVRKST